MHDTFIGSQNKYELKQKWRNYTCDRGKRTRNSNEIDRNHNNNNISDVTVPNVMNGHSVLDYLPFLDLQQLFVNENIKK